MRRERMLPYSLQVFTSVVHAFKHSTRGDRKRAKRMYIERYGREQFDRVIAPCYAHPDGVISIFYEKPGEETKPFVDFIAAVTDQRFLKMGREERDRLLEEKDVLVTEMEELNGLVRTLDAED